MSGFYWRIYRWIERTYRTRQHGSQWCARRSEAPYQISKGPDFWRRRPNGDLVCSYCGSLHPDLFLKFCQNVIDNPGLTCCFVERTTKNYKFYLHGPRGLNAGEGAIKFYMQHAPLNPDDNSRYDAEFIGVLNRALTISDKKFADLTGGPR